jgi:DNA-binding response OmpR family regulator
MVSTPVGDVRLVRWPAQADLRRQFLEAGVPCLLVVEGDAMPPLSLDIREDWVRAPISRHDLHARLAVLRARARTDGVPRLDECGTLHFRGESVPISATQTNLMQLLVARFGAVVAREALRAELTAHKRRSSTRNSLDLHIMRMRRRIQPLDLAIRTVWGRGYVLERQLVGG